MAAPNLKVHVRDASIADLAVIVEFNASLAQETESKTLAPDVLEQGVRTALSDPARLRYWVAEHPATDGRVVGQAAVTREWSDWRNGWIWWFQSVYVEKNSRGSGIFRALHHHIRELALHSEGVIGLRLYVEHENDVAMRTYESLGLRDGGYLVYEEIWPEKFGGALRSNPPTA